MNRAQIRFLRSRVKTPLFTVLLGDAYSAVELAASLKPRAFAFHKHQHKIILMMLKEFLQKTPGLDYRVFGLSHCCISSGNWFEHGMPDYVRKSGISSFLAHCHTTYSAVYLGVPRKKNIEKYFFFFFFRKKSNTEYFQ